MTGELSFFELGVEDPARGRAFYEALFGWSFEPSPSGGGVTIGTPTALCRDDQGSSFGLHQPPGA
jgi:predicted enzyme related to lactoylglutathione lyase